MKTNLPHINKVRKLLKDGTYKYHYYHRRTRKKIVGEPGTAEFLESYSAASKSDGMVKPGTLHALAVEYMRSRDFADLRPRTQADYRRILDRVLIEFSDAPFPALEDKRIRKNIVEWRDAAANSSPRQADYAVAILSRVLQYGCDTGQLSVNNAHGIGTKYKANRSDKIWTEEDIREFLRAAGPSMALALRLALDTGQRQGDLLKLTWTCYDGQAIRLRQSKTGQPVYIPCTTLLKEELARQSRTSVLILTGRRGRPWTDGGFRTEWRKVAVAAGIQGRLTFNDIRGTTVTRLAEHGCEVPEIAAITGHSIHNVTRILETYLSRTDRLADNAIKKLEHGRNQ